MKKTRGLRIAIVVLALFVFSALAIPVFAEPVEILAEGTYQMGDNDTPAMAEERALLKAKRNALDQSGTLVTRISVENRQISDELLVAFSTGVIKVSILDTQRTQVGNGMEVRVKIKAIVDTVKFDEFVKNLSVSVKSTSITPTTKAASIYEDKELLKYNGLYRAVSYHSGHYFYYYYRFFADGTVTSYFTSINEPVAEIYNALDIAPGGKGKYSVQNGVITFSLHFPKGNVVYKGKMDGEALRLKFHSYIINTDGGYDCKFIEVN